MVYYKKYSTQNIVYIAIAIGCAVFFLNQLWEFYNDDAYIVLTYSRNLLEGNGLVWTDGQRVEGCTQFLWVVLIASVGWLNIDLVLASKLLGIFFAFSTLLLFFTGKKKIIPIGGLLLATNCCFAFWACGGLEPVMCSFFIFLGCTLYLRENKSRSLFFINGTIFCFAAMTRLEGLLFFGVTFLFILFFGSLPFKRRFKNTVFFVMGFLIVFLPYFIWRFVYFGHLFPCPFYAKGGTNIFKMLFGARYLLHFLATFGFPLVLILFVKNFRNFITKHIYLILLISAYSFYVFVVGGDHMPGYRFFVPILPLFYLFIHMVFSEVSFRQNRRVHMLVLIIIVSINFFVSFNSIPRGISQNREAMKHSYKYRNCFNVPDHAAYVGKHVGLYIKDNWPANATIALNVVGAIPYYSGLRSIDMLGLNDYTIAQRKISYDYSLLPHSVSELTSLLAADGRKELVHKLTQQYLPWQLIPGHGKGDGQYVLSLKPDFIILGFAHGADKPSFLGDKEILSSPDFYSSYILRKAQIKVSDRLYPYFFMNTSGSFDFTYYERTN